MSAVSTAMNPTYESNLVIFLSFCLLFTQRMFIVENDFIRNNSVCSLETNIDRFVDLPDLNKDSEALADHD